MTTDVEETPFGTGSVLCVDITSKGTVGVALFATRKNQTEDENQLPLEEKRRSPSQCITLFEFIDDERCGKCLTLGEKLPVARS